MAYLKTLLTTNDRYTWVGSEKAIVHDIVLSFEGKTVKLPVLENISGEDIMISTDVTKFATTVEGRGGGGGLDLLPNFQKGRGVDRTIYYYYFHKNYGNVW